MKPFLWLISCTPALVLNVQAWGNVVRDYCGGNYDDWLYWMYLGSGQCC